MRNVGWTSNNVRNPKAKPLNTRDFYRKGTGSYPCRNFCKAGFQLLTSVCRNRSFAGIEPTSRKDHTKKRNVGGLSDNKWQAEDS